MRLLVLASVVVACGGNDVDPRLITGGGIGDGPIDGVVNVFVIDDDDNAIANATVRVGDVDQTTDERGLVVFGDVSGKQTISVVASDFRQVVWVGANGANVTIPITPLGVPVPEQATLAGSIIGWDSIVVPQGHVKAAIALYSQTDDLGDEANNLATPNMANICGAGSATCDWTLVSRAGPVTVTAVIVDLDPMGTPDRADDVTQIIGWATLGGITVQDGVNQSGLALQLVETGNLENLAIDLGTPPAGLTQTNAIVGIEAGDDEVIQLPVFLASDPTMLLAPKPTVFAADATYRLTAIAQTTSGNTGAQSLVVRRGETGTSLAAGDWLVPPTGVDVTRTSAAFQPVAGAKVHQVQYQDATGDTVVEVTIFDDTTALDLPAVVTLPAGTLTARVAGIGATLDVTDFSLEEDDDLLFGIATEPRPVP